MSRSPSCRPLAYWLYISRPDKDSSTVSSLRLPVVAKRQRSHNEFKGMFDDAALLLLRADQPDCWKIYLVSGYISCN